VLAAAVCPRCPWPCAHLPPIRNAKSPPPPGTWHTRVCGSPGEGGSTVRGCIKHNMFYRLQACKTSHHHSTPVHAGPCTLAPTRTSRPSALRARSHLAPLLVSAPADSIARTGAWRGYRTPTSWAGCAGHQNDRRLGRELRRVGVRDRALLTVRRLEDGAVKQAARRSTADDEVALASSP
jgi:hypothetical protein